MECIVNVCHAQVHIKNKIKKYLLKLILTMIIASLHLPACRKGIDTP